MAITTTTILPPAVRESFGYKLLSVPVPNFIHKIPATLERMPRNGGDTLRRRRFNSLATATVPLGNSGITPPPVTLTAVDIDARISWYGQYIILNEQVTLSDQSPVLNEAAERLGVSLRQTEDELTRDMLASTAARINCVGGVNGDSPTEISASDVGDIVRTLLGNDARTISSQIEGADKFGTAPIRNSFFALAHTDITNDLQGVDGFTHSSQYPQVGNILPSEWGTVQNLRFLVSSVGSTTTASSMLGNDVYNIFCVGMEAYGCVEQDGASAQFLYRPPIYSDPLFQNATVGYKFAEVPRITNDLWVLNMAATLAT